MDAGARSGSSAPPPLSEEHVSKLLQVVECPLFFLGFFFYECVSNVLQKALARLGGVWGVRHAGGQVC